MRHSVKDELNMGSWFVFRKKKNETDVYYDIY